MIDVENDVFDYVYRALEGIVPEGCISAEYDPAPPALPFVTLIEIDNYTDLNKRGTAETEEYAILSYEANVYAESKQQCKCIANLLDEAMARLNFSRLSMQQVTNLADPTIHRMVGRYRAEANPDKTMFRR